METNVSIVKPFVESSVSIGVRLREERERLGFNQEAFARLTPSGTRQSQSNYEKGARSPDARYLAAVSAAGADVLYIVIGKRLATSPASFQPAKLRRVIEGVEGALLGKRLRLTPAKKAELITLLYEHFSGHEKVERVTVDRFLRLVA